MQTKILFAVLCGQHDVVDTGHSIDFYKQCGQELLNLMHQMTLPALKLLIKYYIEPNGQNFTKFKIKLFYYINNLPYF